MVLSDAQRNRSRGTAATRWLIWHALKSGNVQRSWAMIASRFGVDHTSVLYGVRQVKAGKIHPSECEYERRWVEERAEWARKKGFNTWVDRP